MVMVCLVLERMILDMLTWEKVTTEKTVMARLAAIGLEQLWDKLDAKRR